MASPTTDVFVSYKAEDRARLSPLVKALEAEGFDVWWDAHIGTGADWREEIQQHLDAARCVIVAWSKSSVGPDGHFVRDEANRAKRRGSYMPIRLDDVEPPLGFGEVQAPLFSGWKGKRSDPRFVALIGAVHEHLKRETPVARRAVIAGPKVSRRNLIAGGVGALTVGGIGSWALLKPGARAASNRIAVMSFANMSGDPAQAYFSDGIAEELRGALSRIGMQVIGKASCDAVKNLEIPAAAARLGVANILTGSVRRSPETIRVAAQLVGGHDGIAKWAQNYDRAPGDTIKIQSDIAAQVASALSIALGAAKNAALKVGGTANADAQDLLLRAKAIRRSADSQQAYLKIIALIDAAIAADPAYGDARIARADMLASYAIVYAASPTENKEIIDRADESAKQAAALMPGSSRPIAMLAEISVDRLDYLAAMRAFGQALATQPNDGFVIAKALNSLPFLGNSLEALDLADRYIALDPLNPSARLERGVSLFVLRRYAGAIDAFKKVLAIAPDVHEPQYFISSSLILLNRPGEARAVLAKMPNEGIGRLINEAILAARIGDPSGAESNLSKIRFARGDSANYRLAQIYAQLGDIDRTFTTLDKAVEARDSWLIWLKRDPFLDPIRHDPRYNTLLKRLDFP